MEIGRDGTTFSLGGGMSRPGYYLAPRGFDAADPMIDDLKQKSVTASLPLTDQQMQRPDLVKTFVRGCEKISPLITFLASATGANW